jgi:hypothetical protein
MEYGLWRTVRISFFWWCINGRNYFGLTDGVNVRVIEFDLEIIILYLYGGLMT